ncbi:hypothetical protein SAMN05428940_4821 [Streptomyces sp. 2133.1]|nr:hypothetical protein BX261_4795 [Streptomyces sp. 2321.6]SED44968.1 hypothetical protein SAMN05428940_4821 [Streptomyces sp. 2133.1]SNC70822.1 hypothetical protein SAMN06272741_4721 [Streptomyces sp. 2114.4]
MRPVPGAAGKSRPGSIFRTIRINRITRITRTGPGGPEDASYAPGSSGLARTGGGVGATEIAVAPRGATDIRTACSLEYERR